jgi:ATP-dependent HslUV protease ATP-binding subunit HslU
VRQDNGGENGAGAKSDEYARRRAEQEERIRERLREQVRSGVRDSDEITIEVEEGAGGSMPIASIFGPGMGPGGGMDEGGMDALQGMLGQMFPKRRKSRRVTIKEARAILSQEAARSLIDNEQLTREAVERPSRPASSFWMNSTRWPGAAVDARVVAAGRT